MRITFCCIYFLPCHYQELPRFICLVSFLPIYFQLQLQRCHYLSLLALSLSKFTSLTFHLFPFCLQNLRLMDFITCLFITKIYIHWLFFFLKYKKQKIPHCQNNSKIQHNNHRQRFSLNFIT